MHEQGTCLDSTDQIRNGLCEHMGSRKLGEASGQNGSRMLIEVNGMGLVGKE